MLFSLLGTPSPQNANVKCELPPLREDYTSGGDSWLATATPRTQPAAVPAYDYDVYISRTWALVIVSLSIIGVVCCLWMLVYVVQKMCDQTLQGSQTMGMLLLLGVTGLFASVVPWLLPPNDVVCTVRHLMHPMLLALCFAILVIKTMQLRSLVTIGLAGYIPMVNQLVSLVFMVAVQVVIEAEWFYSSRPVGFDLLDGSTPICQVTRGRFILLHIYPCALVLLAFCYGVSVINYKYNSNEGRWISMSLIFIIPVMAVWLVIYSFAPEEFGDPTVAVALILISGLLLSILFVPKMIAIADQSKLNNKLNTDSGGGSSGGGIFAQWPQWNASYKGRPSWSPHKWFSTHAAAMPYPRVGASPAAFPAQYGSDLFPLYSPSGGSGSNGSPVPRHRYAAGGRRRPKMRPPPMPRARPLLPVYTSPKWRAATRPYRVQQPPPTHFSYATSGVPQFYFGENKRYGTPSARTPTAKSSATTPTGAKAPRIPAPDHQESSKIYFLTVSCISCLPIFSELNTFPPQQLVTKFVPESKIKSKPSGIVVGGACSCCEAGGKSIPRGSVTDYSSAKRKNSSGTSTSHSNSASASAAAARNNLKSTSTTSLVPSLIEAECYPGTVIITPDNESYGDDGIWTHKYDPRA